MQNVRWIKCKPSKIWVDKGSDFYNRFLQNNDIEMYSLHNEGKSVVAERFIRMLKNKIYVYICKLDDATIHIIVQLKWDLLM